MAQGTSSSNTSTLPLLSRQLRQSVDADDAGRFIDLLDLAVRAALNDTHLAVDDKLRVLAAFVALSRQLEDPEAGIAAESSFLAYAEAALGKVHPVVIAARGRLAMALISVGRIDEAREIAASWPTAEDGRSIVNVIIAFTLLQQGEFREALPILETELREDIRLTGRDNPERAPLLQMLGEALVGAGDPGRASEILEPAIRWSKAGQIAPDTAADVRLTYGRALSDAGRHDAAIAALNHALRDAEVMLGPLHRSSLMLGLALANAHGAAGNLRAYEHLRLRQSGLARQADLHPLELAAALEDMALSLIRFDRPEEAEPILRELMALADASPEMDPRIGLRTRQHLAHVLFQTDPLGDGPALLIEAAAGLERLLGPDHIDALRARAAVIMTSALGPAIADIDIARVRSLLAQKRDGRINPDDLRRDLASLGRFNAAVFGQGQDQPSTTSDTSENIKVLRQLATAEDDLADALTPDGLQAHANLASLLMRAGHNSEALSAIDALLTRLNDPGSADLKPAAGPLLTMRAMALNRLGLQEESLAAFEDAARGVLTTRRWLRAFGNDPLGMSVGFDDGTGWRHASAAWTMARGAGPEVAAGLAARAFIAVQAGDFGVASRALALSETRRLTQTPEAAAALADWEATATAALGHVGASLVVSDLDAITELDETEGRLKAAMPEIFGHLLPDPIGWAGTEGRRGVRDMLGKDEAMVLIVPAPMTIGSDEDPRGFVFAATRDDLAWARIPMDSIELAVAITSLRGAIDPRGSIAQPVAMRAPLHPDAPVGGQRDILFDIAPARLLHDAIFGDPDISGLLATKSSWVLVPQGITMTLPFAALVRAPPTAPARTGADLRAIRWLGLEKALTLLPDVAALRHRDDTAPSDPTTLAYVGFGNPLYASPISAMRSAAGDTPSDEDARAQALGRLPRLPGTRQEVLHFAGAIGPARSRVYLDQQASEGSLDDLARELASQRVEILHFATHGLLAGDISGLTEPALALSPSAAGARTTGPNGNRLDGILTGSEIARLRLRADLVILSACDTSGSAGLRSGFDGLSGLVRGFFLAGARSLLVSHWRIEDEIAVRLIITGVARAATGTDRAEVLRQAMIGVANDPSRDDGALPLSHPRVWAPFFLVGLD